MLVGSLNMFVCKELFRALIFLVEHFKSYIRTEDTSFSLHIGGEFDFGSELYVVYFAGHHFI